MYKRQEWYGKVTGIFYSFGGDVTGSASIRSIKFVKGDPIKKIVLTDEEKITDIPAEEKVPVVSKFERNREYNDNFTDVTVNDWFYDTVASAYEFSLVNGDSDTTYNLSLIHI